MALIPITTVAQYTSGTADHPENGDDLDADEVRAMFQIALDRAHYARGGLWGQHLAAERFGVSPGGTSTVFAVTVGAISSLCVRDSSGTWRPYTVAAETTLDLGEVEGAPASLSNSTWYYVYAYSDGTTTLKFLINTTAPDATGLWQSAGGDALRRYIGCFRTTSGGAPIAVTAYRGRYSYRVSDLGATGLRVLTAGGDTSYTDVDLSALVPPHSRLAELSAYLIPNTAVATTIGSATLRRKGGTVGGVVGIECGTGTQWPSVERSFWLETDTSQDVQYKVAGANAPTLNLDVIGFVE